MSDKFGNQVTQWNGVGIRIIGDDRSGNAILDFDETRGTGAASSLYVVAFGEEENVHGLMGAGGTFEVLARRASPRHLGRVEAYPGICIANPYSVVRVNGTQ